ncbi:MAG: hypothetical protein MUF73_04560 [Rhodobacteraceae bacterium]|jgi:hypothetical protein|nr:hypothetical protein [Paracoccaceae bacterium]
MYRYWECPRCHARTATQSQVAGAYASPACQNAACHRATMQLIGSGVAPVAPPPAPALVAGPAGLPGESLIYYGMATSHGRPLSWLVYRNPAQAEVRITWSVDGSNIREARMHIDLLGRVGANESNWIVRPPFRITGCSTDTWLSLPSRTDGMERIGTFHTVAWAGPPPATFDVRMCLGHAGFGLIHMLAGHVDAMRRWTTAVANVEGEGMQAYRTMQALHFGISELLALGNLREIRRDVGGVWIFVGADDICLVCTQAGNAAFLTVTTTYRRTRQARGELYWKRKL